MKHLLITALCIALLCLSGCTDTPEQTRATESLPAQSEPVPEATVPNYETLPEQIVTPDEMPEKEAADALLPPQPQPTVITQ